MASGKLLEACWLGAGGEPKGCLPEAKSWGAGGGKGGGEGENEPKQPGLPLDFGFCLSALQFCAKLNNVESSRVL